MDGNWMHRAGLHPLWPAGRLPSRGRGLGARCRGSRPCPFMGRAVPAPSGRRRFRRLAGPEAVFDLLDIEIAADEDEAGFALLAVLPGALVVALDDHVDALYDIALLVALEGDN